MMFSANYTMKVSIRSKMFLSSLNQNLTYVLHVRTSASELACRSLNQNLTYVLHARASASELSCRSLNQNLPSVLDVDSLSGGQSGEAAAGEVKEVTIYEFAIYGFIGGGGDGGGKRNMIELFELLRSGVIFCLNLRKCD